MIPIGTDESVNRLFSVIWAMLPIFVLMSIIFILISIYLHFFPKNNPLIYTMDRCFPGLVEALKAEKEIKSNKNRVKGEKYE